MRDYRVLLRRHTARPLDTHSDDGGVAASEFLVGWANRVLTNLERWFADRDFVATKSFT